jgi:hypothetical protein
MYSRLNFTISRKRTKDSRKKKKERKKEREREREGEGEREREYILCIQKNTHLAYYGLYDSVIPKSN